MDAQRGTQPARQQQPANQGQGDDSAPRARLDTTEQARQAAALIEGGGGTDPDDDDDAGEGGGADDGAPGDDDAGDGGQPGDGDPGDDDAQDDDDDQAGAVGKPQTLDEAAKRAGMTRAEFNALPVQVGPHTMTLGELKGKLPELAKLDQSRAELDDQRGEVELRRVDTERRSRAMLDAVPPGALPVLEERVRAQHRETLRRESELLMSARPKWADQTYSAAERERMAKVGAAYGFSKAEIGSMIDHRAVLLLQDYTALREQVQAGKELARKAQQGGDRLAARQVRTANGTNQSAPGRGKPTQGQLAEKVGRILSR